MNQFSVIERIWNKIRELTTPFMTARRQKKLNNIDFTIISNNCWGGIVYEHFGLPKNSPTVGLYLFPDDYLKLVSNLKYYMSLDMKMITYRESRYKTQLIQKHEEYAPVGQLDDIEVVFLHYKTPEQAKEKWQRRVRRINWNNIILKFSYMNNCTDAHIDAFEQIEGIKKVTFVSKAYPDHPNCIVIPDAEGGQIHNDTFYYDRYINLIELINAPTTSYNM